MADDGIKKTGVELVAENAAGFVANLNKGAGALGVFERANKLAAAAVNALGEIGIGALRRIGELGVNALVRAGREVLRFAQNTIEAAAQNTALSRTLDTLGERLLGIVKFNLSPLFDQFNGLVQRTQPAIEGWVAFLSKSFATLGQNALTWGENIAGQLAQGIYAGAQMVLDALIYLGSLITNLLMPGSPPKLLPDLDDWGREAANVYLAAWTKADFSVFSTIGNQIESLLRSQAGRNDVGLIPRILGTREAIAQAIEQARQLGQVTTAALQAIYKAAGATTPELQGYLTSVFNLEAANGRLKAAQDELNAATVKYQQLLKPVDAELARIGEAQTQFSEAQEASRLALILKDPNATSAEKQQAQLRLDQIAAEQKRRALVAEQAAVVDTAQAKVDAAQQAVEAAQAQYDADAARIAAITEENRLLQEQASLLDRLAVAAAPKAPAGGGGNFGGGGLDIKIPEEVQEKIDAIIAKLQIFRAVWQIVWALIQASPIYQNIKDSLQTLTDFWNENQELIKGATKAAFAAILAIIMGALTIITGFISGGLTILKGIWDGGLKILRGDTEGGFEDINTAVTDGLTKITAAIKDGLDYYLQLFDTNVEDIGKKIKEGWDGFNEKVTTALQTGSDNLNQWLNDTSENLIETWTGIFENAVTIVTETDWIGLGKGIIDGLVEGVISVATKLAVAVADAAAAALQAAKDALGIASPSKEGIKIGVNFGESIAKGIAGRLTAIESAAAAAGLAAAAATKMAAGASATVSAPMSGASQARGSTSSVTNNYYNYSPSYGATPVAPQLDFAAMNTWAAS